VHEQTNSKNSPDSFSSSWSSVHQLRNTWVGGWRQPAWTRGVNAHHIHPLYTQRHVTLTLGAYFLTNSLRSTCRKYKFCVLVPVCIVCTVPLWCVVYWGWVEQLKKRIHIYHFHVAYCLAIWRVKHDWFLLWCNNYELLCLLVGFWHLYQIIVRVRNVKNWYPPINYLTIVLC